jgi:hypothetical protein
MTNKAAPASVEDLFSNPHAFGFPTFAEFAKEPDKYRYTLNERLGHIDKSVHNFRELVQKHRYRLGSWCVDTLEEIERIAKSEGVDLMRCKLAPVVERHAGGKVDIEIEFVPDTGVLDAGGKPVLRFFQRLFSGKKQGVKNEIAPIT